ncbi:MAG: hypothetical protein R2838_14710 [Caldilineaceae bacterium]
MAQNNGTEGQAIVDVTIVVGVENMRTLAVGDDEGIFVTPIAEVGVHAVGDVLLRLLKQGAGFA